MGRAEGRSEGGAYLSCVMGCFGSQSSKASQDDSKNQKRRSDAITRQLQKDKQVYRATHRLLLLGKDHGMLLMLSIIRNSILWQLEKLSARVLKHVAHEFDVCCRLECLESRQFRRVAPRAFPVLQLRFTLCNVRMST